MIQRKKHAAFIVVSCIAFAVVAGQACATGTSCPARVEFRGFVGRKAAMLLDGRVYSRYAREDVMDEAVCAFETHYDDTHKKGRGYWQGEFWGKTMLGHAGALKTTDRDDVREYVMGQVRRLVSGYMGNDGYLGTYADPRFVKGGWNLWGRKYTLWALVEAYEATGEKWILDAAAKTADQMIVLLADMKIPLRETGSFKGLASCSMLFPFVCLYRHVPKPEYLAFMKSVVADWDRADNAPPNLIANAFSGKPVHEWHPDPVIWAKSYEMMSCYEGLVAYADVIGGRGATALPTASAGAGVPFDRIIEAAVRFADLLAEHEANAMGAVGYYDHFTHAAANPNGTIEMCDVIYWMRLCHALYRVTGETRHLDRAERAFCNAFLAGLYECGRWGAYSVRSHGYRHGTAGMCLGMRHHTCCVDNSPRGIYDFADHVAYCRGDVLEVNYYLPATVRLENGIVVEISGNYPVSEDVRVEVSVPHARKIAFRVPEWCKELTVGGRHVSGRRGRIVMDVPAGCNSFALRFEMPATIVHRSCVGTPALLSGDESDGRGNDGYRYLLELPESFPEMRGVARESLAAYVTRGPLVLAKSVRHGLGERDVFSPVTINGDRDWKACTRPVKSDGGAWGKWELTLEKGGERHVTVVSDFASAAPSDDWHNAFSIWF